MTALPTTPANIYLHPDVNPGGKDFSNDWNTLMSELNRLEQLIAQTNTVVNANQTGAIVVSVLPLSAASNLGYFYLLQAASQINAQVQSEPSVSNFWPLNETVGATVAHDLVGGLNSSSVSNMTFGSTAGAADGQTSVIPVSTSGYIEFPSMPPALHAGDFTIELLMYHANTNIFRNYVGDSTSDILRVVKLTNRHVALYNNGVLAATSTGTVAANGWDYWAVTYDSTAHVVSFWDSGVLDSQTTVTLTRPALADKFRIGDVMNNGTGMAYNMEKVAIYDSVLSIQESIHNTAILTNNDSLWIAMQAPYGSSVMANIVIP